MDEIDRKILVELDKNVRFSNTQIAKAARTSKDVVNYRINKLQKDGILTGFYCLPNTGKTGKILCKLLLKFQSIGKEKEQELWKFIGDDPRTVWVGSCDGTWNMIATLSLENFRDMADIISRVNAKYGKYLSKKEMLIITSVTKFNEKYLYPKGAFIYETKFTIDEPSIDLDKKDRTLLKELSINSRMSTVDLSKKINLTPEATAKRLKRLEKEGVILGYKPRINFAKLGYDYFHLFISAKNPQIVKEIIQYYKTHPNCVYALEEAGYYDMHLEFVVKGTQRFREILEDLRDKFGDKIHEYEPLQIYTEYKIVIYPS
ncbi:MAG TPA: Lrp/AsnC family transcriptional regulator [archaeon]|nr:Lrp/AsnC family transcriptional regulator [archaeon]